MDAWRTVLAAAGLVAAGLAAGPAPAAEEARGSFGDDRYVAGDDVMLEEDVTGDALVVGGRSEVAGRVGGDALVTGGTVDVRGEIGEDVYAAGGDVRVEATVRGNLRAAGGSVSLEPGASVAGNATLAGGNVDVYGKVGGGLQAFGGRIRLNGEVAGDVEAASDNVRVGPDARIGGKLLYRGPGMPEVAEGAVIAGGVEKQRRAWKEIRPESGIGRAAAGVMRALWFAGVLLLGVLFVALFPAFSRQAAATVRSDALASVGLGLALLVAVPVVAVVLFVTIIGIPLGFAVLLGYALMLMLGYITGALALGDLLLAKAKPAESGSPGWRILFLVLALLVVALVRRIPVVGELAVFALFLAGFGAFALRALRGYRGADAP